VYAQPESAAVDRFWSIRRISHAKLATKIVRGLAIRLYMRRDSKLHLQAYVIQTLSDRQDISVSEEHMAETKTSHEATLVCSSRHALLAFSGQHFVPDFVQTEHSSLQVAAL